MAAIGRMEMILLQSLEGGIIFQSTRIKEEPPDPWDFDLLEVFDLWSISVNQCFSSKRRARGAGPRLSDIGTFVAASMFRPLMNESKGFPLYIHFTGFLK